MARSRILLIALVATLLYPYAELLALYWVNGPQHAIASLVALIGSAFVFWRQRSVLSDCPPPVASGLALAVLAMFVLTYTLGLTVFPKRSLIGFSATAIVCSLVYLRVGSRGLRTLWIPLVLLILSNPLPGAIAAPVNHCLTSLAAFLSTSILGWFVRGVGQSGLTVTIQDRGSIVVVDDCSGLDGILLFVPLAIILVYCHPKLTMAAKCAVLLLAIPLALFGNLIRIVVTGFLQAHDVAIIWSEGFHNGLGVVSLGLALLGLLLLPRLLRRRTRMEPA